MKKRILITAGGTGGHLFPAIAVAQQLENYECYFAAGGLNQNKIFDKDKFSFKDVTCGGFHPKNILQITRGIKESRQFIKEVKPQLVVGFGSYHTFPVLAAAVWEKIPIVLHESNCVPGKVNKWMSYFAEVTGIFLPEAENLIKGKSISVDMPLRKEYFLGSMTRQAAASYFSLDPNIQTLLIFGGSQGSKALNELVIDILLKQKESSAHNIKINYQILHFTGDANSRQHLQKLYKENGITACVKEFEPRMDIAWQASDFCITRAGAGSIAEQIEFEVPGILIPYPYAADDHQMKNAAFMQNEIKGANVLIEKKLTGPFLFSQIELFFSDNGKKMTQMVDAIRKYKERQQRKDTFVKLVEKIIEKE